MPICAIHELSIACRDKVNKCKYYTLYKQLKQKEQEVNKFKQALDEIEKNIKGYCKNMCMAETKETCDNCQNTEILNIINETKREDNK